MNPRELQNAWIGAAITLNVTLAFAWLSTIAIACRAIPAPVPDAEPILTAARRRRRP